MKNKNIVKRYSFSKEEREKLRDLNAGITISNAQINGMIIYKNVILEDVYKRCGIDGDPQKGYSKSITYNLAENVITYTQTPVMEEKNDVKK